MRLCRRCGQQIQWHRTVAGKPMPLDPGAHPDGNCFVNADGVLEVLGKGDSRLTDGSVVLLMPHFATCPKWPSRATQAKPKKETT